MATPLRQYYDQVAVNIHQSDSSQQHYLATHDLLTGIYNENMFVERVEHEIKYSERYNLQFAYLVLDINGFRQIKNVLGVSFGDLILKEIAKRIKSTIRTTDTVARKKADQFMLLLPNITTANEVAKIAKKVLSLVTAPMQHEGQDQSINAALAISLYPHDGDTLQNLSGRAHQTLKKIKSNAGVGFQFYREDITEAFQRQIQVENELKQSLSTKDVDLLYQPIINTCSSEILQLKATFKTKHNAVDSNNLPRLLADPVEQNITGDIDNWLLEGVCKQIQQWSQAGTNQYQVAVELNKQQYFDFSIIDKLERLLNQDNIDGSKLVIEIRQQTILEDFDQAVEYIHHIKRLGVAVTVSDFGNGQTDINLLKILSIDNIKLSNVLVENLQYQQQDQIITYGIISIAGLLGIAVIAEGVNNPELLDILSKLKCYKMQGDIIHHSISEEEVATL